MPPRPRKQGPIEVTAGEPSAKGRLRATPSQKKPNTQTPTKKELAQSTASSHRAKKAFPRKFLGAGDDDSFQALLEPFYYRKSLTDRIDTAQDKWNLLPAFLKVKGLVKQHIDSFDHFVHVQLKKIVQANKWVRSDINDKFWFQYTDIRIGRPCREKEDQSSMSESDVTPNECRLRDLTYAAPIRVDYKYWRDGKIVSRKDQPIGRLPVMLRSSKCVLKGCSDRDMTILQECVMDPGGYFIVKGQEKVILVQEQLSKNRVLVESQKGIIQASVTSSTNDRKSKSYVLLKKDKLFLRHNTLSEDVPIVIVFRAMGVQSDYEILMLTAGEDSIYQDLFAINFEEATQHHVHTQQQALEYIGARLRTKRPFAPGYKARNLQQQAMESLASVIISHIPVQELDFRHKALYVAFMVRRVLMVMHDPSLVDDRDYVGNKRLELAGQLLSLLFEDHFKRFNTEFKATIDRNLSKRNPVGVFDAHFNFSVHHKQITSGMERAIATGNWNLKRFRMERAGVSHVLSRLSYISALGMMTRINSQFEKTRKISGPRSLQSSQFGMLCPSDTPEGESCGLVKNLALMTHITTEDRDDAVRDIVFLLGAEDAASSSGTELYNDGAYLILVNGTPIAVTRQPRAFLKDFRHYRRTSRISEFVSAYVNDHHFAVHIATDEGRICRPLIIVERARSKVTKRSLQSLRRGSLTFDDFLSRGLVEYLDVNEENDANIAVYEEEISSSTTHLEIEPFTILGAVAGLIPYPHHNQSPRNTYQCAMGKQAIGAIAYNQFTRIDTLLFLMVYPQKPMVKTRAIELVKYDKLPAGQNSIVAVMSYSGYDIEDALVLNKASCDRGFGRCQVYRKTATQMKKYANGTSDRYGDRVPQKRAHRHLGKDGIIEVGPKLESEDAYLTKKVPLNTSATDIGSDIGTDDHKEIDMVYKLPDPCYIDKVLISQTEDLTPMLKISTRQTRRPEVGDKFSSRHGQKGVVGIIAEQVDLPFTDEGIVPDVIMNPHGFPSRMTVGKMLELVAGKAGVLRGTEEYGTAFGGSKIEDMSQVLIERGFSYSGKDFMTCGITGESLPAYVFFGPIYYQKLKHMVQDKMHSRATGPRQIMSRQPTEGRSRGGGLRLGEMERDCLIAYGASQLLLERLMLSSDKHECDVCETCGMMGYHGWCQTCQSSKNVVTMTIPYATKLLIQELLSMNIKATLKLEDAFQEEL